MRLLEALWWVHSYVKYIAGVGKWLVSYIYINLINVLNTARGEWETQHITHFKNLFTFLFKYWPHKLQLKKWVIVSRCTFEWSQASCSPLPPVVMLSYANHVLIPALWLMSIFWYHSWKKIKLAYLKKYIYILTIPLRWWGTWLSLDLEKSYGQFIPPSSASTPSLPSAFLLALTPVWLSSQWQYILVFSLFGFSFFPCFCPSWTTPNPPPLPPSCPSISSLFWLRLHSRRHRERLLERQPVVEEEPTANATWKEETGQHKRDSIQTQKYAM